nr:LysR substrate-binding domain-containing protein [Novosphingobium terrae]
MRLTNLDMDALRSLVTGLDAGSFVRAADRLGRSTSAISAHLKKLEEQTGAALLRKSGRGLIPTEQGELLLSYARRLLLLNDEAMAALRGVELEGRIRLGLQEDFGETILTHLLGRFARAHPKVRIEGRIARNIELTERLAAGALDLILAWDDGVSRPHAEAVAAVPLCWLGATDNPALWTPQAADLLPLAVLEAPCMLRDIACAALDRQGQPWRIAFTSPSLSGVWAATAAGLGIALRTPIGHAASVCRLEVAGLPELPVMRLMLDRADDHDNPLVAALASLIRETLPQHLPREWGL